jgi:hypothetical protein
MEDTMPTVRRLFVLPLAALLALSSTPAVAGQHVVPPSQVAATLADHVAKQNADRTTVREALARPEVQRVAATIGLDLARATAAVDTMSGADLERAATAARDVNKQLVGGASTVVISTTTVIIALLIVIIIILVAD